jgi:hypothetical protein
MLYYLLDFIKNNSLGSENIANSICSCGECINNIDLKGQCDVNFSASRISYSDFGSTKLMFKCKRITIRKELNVADNIFDTLGFFSSRSPKCISMCHELILKHANKLGIPYSVLFDIVSVHEYAHMIHYHFNKTKFKRVEIGFKNRTHYVESWAQWCTHNFCIQIDGKASSLYCDAFEKLNKGQRSQYQDFKRFNSWCKTALIHLFLNPNGWDGLLCDGLINDLGKENANWGDEVRQNLARVIESEMRIHPKSITIKLKNVWGNPKFASIKNLINIPEKFPMDDLNTLTALNDVGL